jgi:hypothetical protein
MNQYLYGAMQERRRRIIGIIPIADLRELYKTSPRMLSTIAAMRLDMHNRWDDFAPAIKSWMDAVFEGF